ncbi:hypothetical protein [Pseudonocardia sp.]|uniref:hypothetical protein n=1 Tax=Pseudonocardia sp. TaxID=60912 RepID=UPI003D09A9FE
MLVRRGLLHPGEITCVGDVRVTTPLRTAFDLARSLDPDEAVVAVDRLANRHRFPPDLLLNFGARYRGRRGVARLAEVLARAERFAGSPMATRMRLLVVAAGLPRPHVQWVVQDLAARTAFWLDLAWPCAGRAVEVNVSGVVRPGDPAGVPLGAPGPGRWWRWRTARTRGSMCSIQPDDVKERRCRLAPPVRNGPGACKTAPVRSN